MDIALTRTGHGRCPVLPCLEDVMRACCIFLLAVCFVGEAVAQTRDLNYQRSNVRRDSVRMPQSQPLPSELRIVRKDEQNKARQNRPSRVSRAGDEGRNHVPVRGGDQGHGQIPVRGSDYLQKAMRAGDRMARDGLVGL